MYIAYVKKGCPRNLYYFLWYLIISNMIVFHRWKIRTVNITHRYIVLEELGVFPSYYFYVQTISVSIEVIKCFNCVTSRKKKVVYILSMSFLLFDLDFDLYVILIGQGQLFIFKWSNVSSMYSLKVVSVLTKLRTFQGQ